MKEQKDYAIIDVETTLIRDGEIPKTKFWGYADISGYKKFQTSNALLRFLEKTEPKTILHHTNFDVLQLLVDGAKDIQFLKSHNGKFITTKLGIHTLLNSYSPFPLAMRDIFAAFGYKKTDLGQLDKRNYDDCVLGLECFLKLDSIFTELVGVSPLQKGTIAGTGFGAAEAVAGKMPKDLRFLEAYRGGRVEVFDTRKAQLNGFDINSSYPRSFIEAPESDELWHIGVWTKDWHCPFFDEFSDDLLLFPNGKFTSWVYKSNWEKYIEPYAEKTRIKVLKKYKINLSWITRLKDLIHHIYDKKNISEGAVKLACKLLLNSLYGRIGLRGSSERARFLDYKPDGDNITLYKIGKRWLSFDSVLREPRSNFPFAAYITDNARARLYQGFKLHIPSYGDTDSIYTKTKKEDFRLVVGRGLGEWSHTGYGSFQARNVKDYVWKNAEVLKGGKGKTVWTLKRLASGKGAVEVVKTRKTELRKRIVLPNGETIPIVVP